MPFRRVVFWVHLVCGLAVGTVVLVMSVTGVLLTYQKQMTEWADRAHWVPPTVAGRTAPLSEIVTSARVHARGEGVARVTFHSDPSAPVAARLSGGRTLLLDPSTGTLRGESSERVRAFFGAVVGWHRWFNVTGDARAKWRAVTGWSNLAFLFLVMSGLYLWVPRRWSWQHVRPILVYNRSARGKARDFNWHHVFGFWMSVPLALVVASATVISFPWASDLAYRVAGEAPPPRQPARRAPATDPVESGAVLVRAPIEVPAVATVPTVSPPDAGSGGAARTAHGSPRHGHGSGAHSGAVARLDPLAVVAMARVGGWRTITVDLPEEPGSDVSFRIDRGWGGEPQKRHTLVLSPETGAEVDFTTFQSQSPGRRFRTFLRFAHTGEYFGLFGQTVAGLASLVAVLLVWSGFALAWRRLARPLLAGRSRGRAVALGRGSGG